MKASQKYLADSPQTEVLKFNDYKSHTVTLKADREENKTFKDGSSKTGVSFLVEENGTAKEFFTASRDLIANLARFNPGDVVTIKADKKYLNGGGEFTEYRVTMAGEGDPLDVDSEPNGPEVEPEKTDDQIPW